MVYAQSKKKYQFSAYQFWKGIYELLLWCSFWDIADQVHSRLDTMVDVVPHDFNNIECKEVKVKEVVPKLYRTLVKIILKGVDSNILQNMEDLLKCIEFNV